MALLVLVVLAGGAGACGFVEAARVEKRFSRGPLGLEAWKWAIAAAVVGALGAFFSPPVVLALLAGYGGYAGATQSEREFQRELFGLPAYAWGTLLFVFGLLGAAFTSAFAWTVVCLLLGLSAAVALLVIERRRLVADNNRLLAEQAKLTVREDRQKAGSDAPSAPDPRRPAPPRVEAQQWPLSEKPRPAGDLLPERRFW